MSSYPSPEELKREARSYLREKVWALRESATDHPEGVDWWELRDREPCLKKLTPAEFQEVLGKVIRAQMKGEPTGVFGPEPEEPEEGS